MAVAMTKIVKSISKKRRTVYFNTVYPSFLSTGAKPANGRSGPLLTTGLMEPFSYATTYAREKSNRGPTKGNVMPWIWLLTQRMVSLYI